MQRVGLYAWGGPGTIRLLQVKYHSPRIDEASFMKLYDPAFLDDAQHKLGVTDMFVTYSWGFSDETEQPERQYIVERLPNFQQRDIATYAYVQGLNVVTSEFPDRDIFCHDSAGNLLPYSRGRSLTCPNKPGARAIIRQRVEAACQEDFTGIFIDNILFGLPPFYFRRDYASFFGCSCDSCRRAFQDQYGYALPVDKFLGESQLADYLSFRCRTISHLLEDLSAIVRSSQKQFGINLYDPYWYTPEVYFGYDLKQIAPLVDYHLIENYALGQDVGITNRHLIPLIEREPQKPTFVLSYRRGIGHDAHYGQKEVDLIWSDAEALGYAPCLKASEYKTHGQWHALDTSALSVPVITTPTPPQKALSSLAVKTSNLAERRLVRFGSRHYPRVARMIYESKPLALSIGRSHFLSASMRRFRQYYLGEILPSSS